MVDKYDFWADGRMLLTDQSRNLYPKPCPDCGRSYLNGENVTWNVPMAESNSYRTVWTGCVDCWLKRTNPQQ